MGRYLNPGQARDAELVRLERAAKVRRLTATEDARLAELSFRVHARGMRIRFDGSARP